MSFQTSAESQPFYVRRGSSRGFRSNRKIFGPDFWLPSRLENRLHAANTYALSAMVWFPGKKPWSGRFAFADSAGAPAETTGANPDFAFCIRRLGSGKCTQPPGPRIAGNPQAKSVAVEGPCFHAPSWGHWILTLAQVGKNVNWRHL